jgi:hypothetical protein
MIAVLGVHKALNQVYRQFGSRRGSSIAPPLLAGAIGEPHAPEQMEVQHEVKVCLAGLPWLAFGSKRPRHSPRVKADHKHDVDGHTKNNVKHWHEQYGFLQYQCL